MTLPTDVLRIAEFFREHLPGVSFPGANLDDIDAMTLEDQRLTQEHVELSQKLNACMLEQEQLQHAALRLAERARSYASVFFAEDEERLSILNEAQQSQRKEPKRRKKSAPLAEPQLALSGELELAH